MENQAIERAAMVDRPQLPTVRDTEVEVLRRGCRELLAVLKAAYDDLYRHDYIPTPEEVIAWREDASKVIARWIR